MVTGLTPGGNSDTLWLGWLQPCLPHKAVSRHKHAETNEPFTGRMDSACQGKPRFQGRKAAEVFKWSKIIFSSKTYKQKSISICQQETSSVWTNTETQTLCMELHSPCNAITSAQGGAHLKARGYSCPLFHSPGRISTQRACHRQVYENSSGQSRKLYTECKPRDFFKVFMLV